MNIETFEAIDGNGNIYRISVSQDYTTIRDRSGTVKIPGLKTAHDQLGRLVIQTEEPNTWQIFGTDIILHRLKK